LNAELQRTFLTRMSSEAEFSDGMRLYVLRRIRNATTRYDVGSSTKEVHMSERETNALIGSDKVDGTAVYGADQQKIGSVERVMIDKLSGKVAYAVISYGGFMGMGEDHYPTPWSNLKYDTNLGGYLVNLTKDQLEKAPSYADENDWQWSRENDRRVYSYYRAEPFWAG
jgi:hypothetical protein